MLVSLQHTTTEPQAISDWMEQWDALAREIGKAWKSDKSAVEILSEMRR
jgi:hypothetical protein